MNNVLYPLSNNSAGLSHKQKYSLKDRRPKTQRTRQTHQGISAASWAQQIHHLKSVDSAPIKPKLLTLPTMDSKAENSEMRNCFVLRENRSNGLNFSKARSINIKKDSKQNNHNEFMRETAQNMSSFNLASKEEANFQSSVQPFSTSLAFMEETTFNQSSAFTFTFTSNANNQNNQNLENTRSILREVQNGVREKLSLSQNYKGVNSTKSKIFACLKYSDLKLPLRLDRGRQAQLMENNNKMSHQPSEANLAKGLCGGFFHESEGCRCQPKCRWMAKWIAMPINEQIQWCPQIDQAALKKTIEQIEKDIARTHSTTPTFQNPRYRSELKQVLLSYCKLDWEVGYVQGMNLIVAGIIYHSNSIRDSLRVMTLLMKTHGLRSLYVHDLSFGAELAKRLVLQLRELSFDLYCYLIEQNVQLQVFVTSWYLSVLGSFVPLSQMHLVIDAFLRNGFTGLSQIIIAMLIYMKDDLMTKGEEELIVCLSAQEMGRRAGGMNWKQLVWRSRFLQISFDVQII